MQDQDNITQKDLENSETQDTAPENAGVPDVRQNASENTEVSFSGGAESETFIPQNIQETPTVEFSGDHRPDEIPTVTLLDAGDLPPVNNEYQTVRTLEIQDLPKEETPEWEHFIFNGYEVKTWEFNPRIYKILTGSTIFCMLALFTVAQSNSLHTRACDSPLVSKVCQVLDTVYVGSTLLGNDSEWVSEDYQKTELENAEITYIDTSNVSPPLPYPEGYFALANPEMVYNDPTIIPGSEFPTADGFPPAANFPVTPNPTMPNPTIPNNDPINRPAVLPTPNRRSSRNRPLPDSGFVIGDNPIGEGKDPTAGNDPQGSGKEKKPGDKNEKSEDETAGNSGKQKDLPNTPVEDFRPNREPLKKFARDILQLRDKQKGNLDLSRKFSVEMNGTLTPEGKFDKKKSGYVKTDGDEEMINIAKDAIEAIGDSGMLYYLKGLGVEKVNFVIQQTDEGILVVLKSGQATEERARTISSGFRGLLAIAKLNQKPEDAEVIKLLEAAKSGNDGKSFILNFNLDKQTAQAMIKQQLDKEKQKLEEEKQKAQQPSSTTENSNINKNAGK